MAGSADDPQRIWRELENTRGRESEPAPVMRRPGEGDDVDWTMMDAVDLMVRSHERIGYNKGWAAASVEAFKWRAARQKPSAGSLILGLVLGLLEGLALAALLADFGLWR